ncbi:hypothetical protein SHI21_04605 [Bacteriovorax sp. PP10]|uniref:Lipoprotein n=1 Tax=Bacteriovorax antarcticus TaxID=3088717 RepID=A0ABU5VR06_9BACT|nr:hypothetical protein [Bacteriovorax sp. PP10]MEA9355464.1 hypothetical protein [Bacteriovorax sp. PP10]
MKILISFFILVYSAASFASCRLDSEEGMKAYDKADEYSSSSESKIISMKRARQGSALYCSKGQEARMGILAAANTYKKSYELFNDVAENCNLSNYSNSPGNAQSALDQYYEHAKILRQMDFVMNRDCDESPVSILLD